MVKYFGRHQYGHCVVSDKYKIIFITIPKNASTIMSYYITQKLNGYEANYFDCTEEQKQYYTFCILRNIVSRFYSALNTIFSRRIERYNIDSTIKTIFQMDNDNVIDYVDSMVDEHLVRQKEFIKNIRLDYLMDITLIDKLGFDKLNFTLKHYIKEQTIIKIDPEIVDKVYEKDAELFSKRPNSTVGIGAFEEFKNNLKLPYNIYRLRAYRG
jgi:hypothetical protein